MIDEEARETCRQMLGGGAGRAGGQQTPGLPGAPPLRGHRRCLLTLCQTASGAREMGCILHPQAALGDSGFLAEQSLIQEKFEQEKDKRR